jgi:hypothetical protein
MALQAAAKRKRTASVSAVVRSVGIAVRARVIRVALRQSRVA